MLQFIMIVYLIGLFLIGNSPREIVNNVRYPIAKRAKSIIYFYDFW